MRLFTCSTHCEPARLRPSPCETAGAVRSNRAGAVDLYEPATARILRRLERDDVVGRGSGERGAEVGEAANAHTLDGIDRHATPQLALRQATLQRALIAEHEQHTTLAGDLAQALADGVAL